ncbi:MAG: methylmalonyl Co-A mutase-associated GTPase MeaB [Rhodospirillaceae bacterium]|nr:methylmalonyl Co-A mutase-associated GTPase MeaB [Rhodospirillaceae bacterium]
MIAPARPFVALRALFGHADGKAALAKALAEIERAPDAPATLALLDEAWAAESAARCHVVGITGPPGVGKSTLVGALVARWRGAGKSGAGKSVGVIAIDPSSRRSGGALLGDRTRLRTDPEDHRIFIRSMAARDRLGGLAALTFPAAVLMRALFDVLVIETVGVGQSETDVTGVADTVLLCLQPGAGDSLQYMKAGIVEIPHVVAVTKGDLGDAARRAAADAAGALSLDVSDWSPPVLIVSAQTGAGLDDLLAALERHRAMLAETGTLLPQRADQAEAWLAATIRDRFGSAGAARAGALPAEAGASPFRRAGALARLLAQA